MPFEAGDPRPFHSSGAEGCSEEEGEGERDEGTMDQDSRSENENENGLSEEKGGESNNDNDDECEEKNKIAKENIYNNKKTSHKESSKKSGQTKLTMWQLSFSDYTEEEGLKLRSLTSDELLNEALRRCKGWFDPVCDMIKYTPKGEIWGTGLYDRNPMPLRSKDQGSRVTVMGDACHPMSMFKGQGR